MWRRVLVVGFCLIWALFELASGAAFWAMLFGAAGIYLAYQFFIVFDPDKNERTPDGPD